MIIDYHTNSKWKLARRIIEKNNTNPTINTTLKHPPIYKYVSLNDTTISVGALIHYSALNT